VIPADYGAVFFLVLALVFLLLHVWQGLKNLTMLR